MVKCYAKKRVIFPVCLWMFLLLAPVGAWAQTVRYVKPAADGSGNATSWNNATADLQWAINESDSGDVVFVVSGIYNPIRPADNLSVVDSLNRHNAFVLKKGVSVYGGFAGTESSLGERVLNPASPSLLSGDFNGNDVVTGTADSLAFSGNAENAYHVVVAVGEAGSGTLDGFTVTGGYASGGPDITVNGISFGQHFGAGIYIDNASLVLNNVTLANNNAVAYAAGISINKSTIVFNNVFVTDNRSGGQGGGIYATDSSSLTYTSGSIMGNYASGPGGGVYCTGNSSLIFDGVRIEKNYAYVGGGIYSEGNSSLDLNGVTVSENYSSAPGGGLYMAGGTAQISGGSFYKNYSQDIGGAIYASGSSFTLSDVDIYENTAYYPGGAIFQSGGSVTITGGRLAGNSSETEIGGGVYIDSGNFQAINTVFSGNASPWSGGAIYNSGASVVLKNVSVSGNSAPQGGGALYNGGSAQIHNSVIWGNSSGVSGGTVQATYSLIQGENSTVDGNISGNTNPLFVNAPLDTLAPFSVGDYTLRGCSELINAGNNDNVPSTITEDAAGSLRIHGGTVDIGAYEYQGGHSGESINDTLVANICFGDSVTFHGVTFYTDTVYTTTPISGLYCDRLYTLALSVQSNTQIIYVKEVAEGTGDGSSWAHATADLQWAINQSSGCGQVFVAAGTYLPVYRADSLSVLDSANRNNAFVLKKDVRIYGGFRGTENTLAERVLDPNYASVLSGDFLGNDSISGVGFNSFYNYDENAYHVVVSVGDVGVAVLDGFTVTGGNASGWSDITVNGEVLYQGNGGGIVNKGSSPNYVNVVISGNISGDYGGGVYNENASPVFTNISVLGNRAYYGGGVFSVSGSLTLANSIVAGNIAEGGAGLLNHMVSATLINTTISGNTGIYGGGAMLNDNSQVSLYNTVIWGNSSGLENYGPVSITYNHSLVQENTTASGTNLDGNWNPLFVNAPSFETAPFTQADYQTLPCSPLINSGNNGDIAVSLDLGGNPRVSGGTVDIGPYEYQGMPGGILNDTTFASICFGDSVTFRGTTFYTDTIHTTTLLSGPYCDTLATLVLSVIQTPQTFYVKEVAEGAGDGSSWANATADLQWAINQASTCGQVFVAAGTYIPVYRADSLSVLDSANRDNAFVLKRDVRVYGGFQGTESSLAERVLDANTPSVLSGDFNGDDVVTGGSDSLSISGNSENAHHVVISIGNSGLAVLDGFTVTGGNADDWSELWIDGEEIYRWAGGGVYNQKTSPTFRNIEVSGNYAEEYGGGVYAYRSSGLYEKVTVVKNIVYYDGAGLYVAYSDLKFDSSSISLNLSDDDGAGMYVGYSSIVFNNGHISDNYASDDGGGIYADERTTLAISNSSIQNNRGYYGGGIYNEYRTQLTLEAGMVANNEARYGGGLYNAYQSSVNVINTVISGNNVLYSGGAVYNYGADVLLVNSLVSGNYAEYGGAFYNEESKITLTNVTVSANYAEYDGGALYNDYDVLVDMQNSIVWGNNTGIYNDDLNSIAITSSYSLIQGDTSTANGNIDGTLDPLFVNAASYNDAPTVNGDYSLDKCSPAVNEGQNSFVPASVTNDLAGNTRIFGARVDLGAYEYQSTGGVYKDTLFTTLCMGDSVAFNGLSFNTDTVYSVNYPTTEYCDSVITLLVTVNPLPATPGITVGGALVFCANDSVILTADTLSGVTYLWSNGAASQRVSVNQSGSYTVTLTDSNNCVSLASAPVVVSVNQLPAQPNVSASGALSFCNGDSVTLTADSSLTYLWNNGDTVRFVTVTSSGSYAVLVTDSNGCSSVSDTVNVVEYPVVDVTVTRTGNSFSANQAGATYQWINCVGNTPVAGANGQTYTATTNGNYAVVVTTVGLCSDTSECFAVTNVGIAEMVTFEMDVYPNPNDGVFHIRIGNNYPEVSVSIYDVTGRNLYAKTHYASEIITINEILASGTYYVQVEADGVRQVKAFVRK